MVAPQERSKYWSEYLVDSNPCQFPTLIDGANTSSERGRVLVDIPYSKGQSDIQQYCKENGVALHTVFKTAWALVLKSYTGSGAITLGSNISEKLEDRFGLCRLSIDDGDAICDVVKAVQDDFVRSEPHLAGPEADIEVLRARDGSNVCNTTVCFSSAQPKEMDRQDGEVHHFRTLSRCSMLICF